MSSDMRVKILTNPPLPPLKAWFTLTPPSVQSTQDISSLKYLLGTSLPAFRGVVPSSLRLSIDGFELLDNSKLVIVRDGDLICVDILGVLSETDPVEQSVSHATQTRSKPAASRKRKRRPSTPISSSPDSEPEPTTSASESEPESESESETSGSKSTSDSGHSSHPAPSLRKADPQEIHARERAQVTPLAQPKPRVAHPSTLVPPGHGRPQTRARNLRRRLKRMHERAAASVPEGGPAAGANAVVTGQNARVERVMSDSSRDGQSGLLSLSLRNKNKAKNFRSLIGKPLPAKIIFGDQEGDTSPSISGVPPECPTPARTAPTQALPRLIPPSSRSSLPPNLFVTSIDVEAGLHREKKKRKIRIKYSDEIEEQNAVVSEGRDISLDYGDDADKMTAPEPEPEVDKLEAIADERWATLIKFTSEMQVRCGMIVGYKTLGIDPVTCTPEQCLTVARVVAWHSEGVVVQPLRAREQVSFSGPVEAVDAEAQGYVWDDVVRGDWRLVH